MSTLLLSAFAIAAVSSAPRTLFASCIRGLEPVLAAELRSPLIGAADVVEGRRGVHFAGDAAVGAAAVLWSRSALKVRASALTSLREPLHRATSSLCTTT